MPERYRRALFHVSDGLMPEDWIRTMGEWLYHQRTQMTQGGDTLRQHRFAFETCNVDRICEHVAAFRAKLVEAIPDALEPCGIPDWDLADVECHATLYHHGGLYDWHSDAEPGVDEDPPEDVMALLARRRLAFAFYLRQEPAMFTGGELEFLDGTKVEPKNNRLVLFRPEQRHRVAPIRCWSARALHGRWALSGWLHGGTA
jgi:hypothetical protein